MKHLNNPGIKIYTTPDPIATIHVFWSLDRANSLPILSFTLDKENKYDLFYVKEIKSDTLRIIALDFYTQPELTLIRKKHHSFD